MNTQFFIILVLMATNFLHAQNSRMTDSLALVAVYDSCGGENWNVVFDFNNSLEDWSFVRLEDDRVYSLDFDNINLSGGLPVQIKSLDKVRSINLSRNNVQDLLKNLHLMENLENIRLDDSQVPIKISDDVLKCKKLRNFILQKSGIVGQIPDSLGLLSNIYGIDLSDNDYMGPLPTKYSTTLRFIDYSNNQLDLDITNMFSDIMPWLVNLGNNEFTGSFPVGLLKDDLMFLNLSNNNISGSLPTDIGKANDLRTLDLSNNNFEGDIPNSIRRISWLTYLDLSHNNFTGSIGLSKFVYEDCTVLDLSNNQFTGGIPDTVSYRGIDYLDLSSNRLTGSIPPEILSGRGLSSLDLSDNQFSGQIDTSFSKNIGSLKILDISKNDFSGDIPELEGSKLKVLDISENSLTGSLNLNGVPNIKTSSWSSFNLSGGNWYSLIYTVEKTSAFCPGNQLERISFKEEVNISFEPDDFDFSCVQNEVTHASTNKLDEDFSFYPNPTDQDVYLRNIEKDDIIKIFDIEGRQVPITYSSRNALSLPSSGIYQILYKRKGQYTTAKVVVLK